MYAKIIRRGELYLTTPVSSTLSISSCQADLLYSSIIDAIRILSGYSSFNRLNSFSMVSSGRSLMSSIFSHPIISPLVPFDPTRSRAYLGVTFTTFEASRDTYHDWFKRKFNKSIKFGTVMTFWEQKQWVGTKRTTKIYENNFKFLIINKEAFVELNRILLLSK